jgi:hypothetical protein
MKSYHKGVLLGLSSVAVAIVFTGCGAKGEQFKSFKTPAENKSMLYVYRPSSFVGGGVYYDVHATTSSSDEIIGTLKNGGFIEKEMTPAENIEIWAKTESKSSVNLNIKTNEIYCVKGEVGMGLIVGRPYLSIIDKTICEKEIIETNRSYD